MRIGTELRMRFTFDDGQWEKIPVPTVTEDPLRFPDDRPYTERLRSARKATGATDSISIGYGKIQGQPTVACVQDFAFMGGSLGMAAGEAFITGVHEAIARDCPFVIFTASGGARMQEGTLSLMQMARTTVAISELRAKGLPYVVVLTDPTTGGVMASYAMLGDVHLAEPNAMVAFAGRRVIEQTIRETLPPGFQRSEFLVERGMIDKVVRRDEIPAVLGSILQTLMLGRARSRAA
jgi:acetyl-CoA carboxylase carboxyl transferase subunit beta